MRSNAEPIVSSNNGDVGRPDRVCRARSSWNPLARRLTVPIRTVPLLFDAGVPPCNDHDEAVSTLAAELATVEEFVRGLSAEDWSRSTLLEPFDAGSPPWTMKELVAHIDISIGLTLGFLDSIQDGQPGRDRVSFFIADRSQVAPVVYDYAKGLAASTAPSRSPTSSVKPSGQPSTGHGSSPPRRSDPDTSR